MLTFGVSTPLYELAGKCPHVQFLGRGQMSKGANVRLHTVMCNCQSHMREIIQVIVEQVTCLLFVF